MRNYLYALSIYVTVGVLTYELLSPDAVSADRLIMHSSACVRLGHGYELNASERGIENPDRFDPLVLYCPVPTGRAESDAEDEGDLFDFRRATNVSVRVNDRHPYDDVLASVCVTYATGGGQCGVSSASYDIGYSTRPLATTKWTQESTLPTDYPFILVVLPRANDVGNSALLGFTAISP